MLLYTRKFFSWLGLSILVLLLNIFRWFLHSMGGYLKYYGTIGGIVLVLFGWQKFTLNHSEFHILLIGLILMIISLSVKLLYSCNIKMLQKLYPAKYYLQGFLFHSHANVPNDSPDPIKESEPKENTSQEEPQSEPCTKTISPASDINFFAGIRNKEDAKKRYRELVKIFHPDMAMGNTDLMILINEQYEKNKD